MSLTGKFLSKKREDVDSESADIHPFSRVKPKRRRNILLFFLITTAFFIYTSIILIEFSKKEPERIESVVKKETISKKMVKTTEDINKLNYPSINIDIKSMNYSIENTIKRSNILSYIQDKPIFKKEKIRKINDSKRERIISYIKKGKEAEKKGDIKSAIFFYKKAWSLDKNNSDIILKIAYLHYKGGYYKATIKYANWALKIKKDFIPAVVLKAKAYESLGMREKSKAILEEAYFMYPENKEIIFNLANIYEKERSLVVAEDLYKILDEMGYIEGSIGLARVYEKLGYKNKAYRTYRKLLNRPDISEELKYRIEKKLLLLGD